MGNGGDLYHRLTMGQDLECYLGSDLILDDSVMFSVLFKTILAFLCNCYDLPIPLRKPMHIEKVKKEIHAGLFLEQSLISRSKVHSSLWKD